MEQNNRLGLFITEHSATAVLIYARSAGPANVGTFTVTTRDQQNRQSLGNLIRQQLDRNGFTFEEVFVALDCSLSTQHDIHSDFTDARQIANTIKFDIEEAVATDATNMVITSCITDSDHNGSSVSVFAADRVKLTAILKDLQANGMDPTVIEPDIICLARLLDRKASLSRGGHPIFAVLPDHACYIVSPSESGLTPKVRSFFLSPSQDKNLVLAREIPVTLASINNREQVTGLFIGGNIENIDAQAVAERIGIDTQTFSIKSLTGTPDPAIDGTADLCRITIAYAAATVSTGKVKRADFRQDFMPYMGRKKVMQNALRLFCIAATIVLVTLGVNMQLQLSQQKQNNRQLLEKMNSDYSAVTMGATPPKGSVYKALMKVHDKLENKSKGITTGDDTSPTSKLTFILQVCNNAMKDENNPNKIGLIISEISISSKSMRIQGETDGRKETLVLLDEINKHEKLNKVSETLVQKSNRDSFIINLELKK